MKRRDAVVRPFNNGLAQSVQVQSVLYNNTVDDVERALQSLYRAAELSISDKTCKSVSIHYGDSSSIPCLGDDTLLRLQTTYAPALDIKYSYFDGNLGSAKGHNTLAAGSEAEFLLILNPNVVVAPNLFTELLSEFRLSGPGMVEAKQLPVEHPKDYNPSTGETSWATTACALIPNSLFKELGGFDAESFFLYCDDVDFSWRVRLAGYSVVFRPSAVVFHDKRLTAEGRWEPTGSEVYYSAEAALFMAHKWSRPDLLAEYLSFFTKHGDEIQQRAAKTFLSRRNENTLPTPLDADHKIGQFIDYMYARHRFPL